LALLAGFCVSGVAKVIGYLSRVGFLADANIARLSVNFGGVGKNRPAHPLFNDLLVLDVVVREDPEQHEGKNEESSEPGPEKRVSQAATKAFDTRNFYFNGHVPSRRRAPLIISLRLMAGQSVTCAGAEKFLSFSIISVLNPFIERIGCKVQVDRMNDHINVDLVFY